VLPPSSPVQMDNIDLMKAQVRTVQVSYGYISECIWYSD
jgi:hypothetical protein